MFSASHTSNNESLAGQNWTTEVDGSFLWTAAVEYIPPYLHCRDTLQPSSWQPRALSSKVQWGIQQSSKLWKGVCVCVCLAE